MFSSGGNYDNSSEVIYCIIFNAKFLADYLIFLKDAKDGINEIDSKKWLDYICFIIID